MFGEFCLIHQGFIQGSPDIWDAIACRALQQLHLLGLTSFPRQCTSGRAEMSVMVVHSTTTHRPTETLKVSESPMSLEVSVKPLMVILKWFLLDADIERNISPRPFQKPAWFLCTWLTPSLRKTNLLPWLGSLCGFNSKAQTSTFCSVEHNLGNFYIGCHGWEKELEIPVIPLLTTHLITQGSRNDRKFYLHPPKVPLSPVHWQP